MTKGEKLRKKKQRMWDRQNGLCHWCGQGMFPFTNFLDLPEPRSKHLPDNYSTIEHLRSKYDPTRWDLNDGYELRLVLACKKCNEDRGRKEYLEFIENKTIRSNTQ